MFSLFEAVERSQRQRETASSDSTAKFSDSQIAVSVSVEDIRKELLKYADNLPRYTILKDFLDIVPNPNNGFEIFTGDASKVERFTNALNNSSYSKKIKLNTEMPNQDIITHIKVFLNDKIQNVKDEIFIKFYRYVKKVVSLEYKNLNHIPKRRYYNPTININEYRKYLLDEVSKDNHRHDFMYVVLQIPVDHNKGIGLSSQRGSNSACLNALSKTLGCDVDKYLENITLERADINEAFNNFLVFLRSQVQLPPNSIDEHFLRYIIRVVEIEYRGLSYPVKEKPLGVGTQKTEKTLFPSGSPKVDDIEQGHLGDCYLLSALMSIIEKNPRYITDCFPEKDSYTPNQKTVKITLNTVKVTSAGHSGSEYMFKVSSTGKITIEVDNTILIKRYKNRELYTPKPFGNRSTALWVNFMEKAFSVYRNIKGVVTADGVEAEEFVKQWVKDPDHSLSGQNVNGGSEFMAFSIITGKRCSNKFVSYVGRLSEQHVYKDGERLATSKFGYSPEQNKIFDYIYYSLKEGKSLTAGTYNKDKLVFENPKLTGIYPSHSYSIQDAIINDRSKQKYIVLKNPHMKEIFKDPENPAARMPKGTVKVELSEFTKHFRDIGKGNFEKLKWLKKV